MIIEECKTLLQTQFTQGSCFFYARKINQGSVMWLTNTPVERVGVGIVYNELFVPLLRRAFNFFFKVYEITGLDPCEKI